jgi:hypothetical protein
LPHFVVKDDFARNDVVASSLSATPFATTLLLLRCRRLRSQ